ncbi:unnamed protein product [Dovyalis caffra]|uniref:Uncharacterized protein n=1 Tax=Dovyalis caffra TaxID=77055 RepID=A0AAV1R4A0_9ROSI|nr:unnamed protein product [Dovyalis caffra]
MGLDETESISIKKLLGLKEQKLTLRVRELEYDLIEERRREPLPVIINGNEGIRVVGRSESTPRKPFKEHFKQEMAKQVYKEFFEVAEKIPTGTFEGTSAKLEIKEIRKCNNAGSAGITIGGGTGMTKGVEDGIGRDWMSRMRLAQMPFERRACESEKVALEERNATSAICRLDTDACMDTTLKGIATKPLRLTKTATPQRSLEERNPTVNQVNPEKLTRALAAATLSGRAYFSGKSNSGIAHFSSKKPADYLQCVGQSLFPLKIRRLTHPGDEMSSLRTFLSFQERSDAAIERYKLASPEWRERKAIMIARKATSEDAENALGKEYALFANLKGLFLLFAGWFSHFFESRPTSNKQSQRMARGRELYLKFADLPVREALGFLSSVPSLCSRSPVWRAADPLSPLKLGLFDGGEKTTGLRLKAEVKYSRHGRIAPLSSNVCGPCLLAGRHPGPSSGSGRASVEPGLTTLLGWLSGARLMAHPDVIAFICG